MKAELYINGALVDPKEIPEEQREYISYQVVKQFLALTQARSKDIPRIKSRIINWLKSTSGFKEINKNLLIFYPITIPLQYSKIFRFINKHILYSKLKKWIRIQKANKVIVITLLSYPIIVKVF